MKVQVHVLMAGQRIATVRALPTGGTGDPAGDVLYYHRDWQGSVVATTVTGGLIGTRCRYGPYGELDKAEVVTAGSESDLGYAGTLKLSGALLHMRARVYDASVRRFLQADTVDLQRYSYAAGDPRNFTDPSGRKPVSDYNPRFYLYAGGYGGAGNFDWGGGWAPYQRNQWEWDQLEKDIAAYDAAANASLAAATPPQAPPESIDNASGAPALAAGTVAVEGAGSESFLPTMPGHLNLGNIASWLSLDPPAVEYVASTTTGRFVGLDAGGTVVIRGTGYSGAGFGKNNSLLEGVKDIGPTPSGTYRMILVAGSDPAKWMLQPLPGTNTHGRDGLMVHADGVNPPGSFPGKGMILLWKPAAIRGNSSTGCWVIPSSATRNEMLRQYQLPGGNRPIFRFTPSTLYP